MKYYEVLMEEMTAKGGRTLRRGNVVPENLLATDPAKLVEAKRIKEVPAPKPEMKTNTPAKK